MADEYIKDMYQVGSFQPCLRHAYTLERPPCISAGRLCIARRRRPTFQQVAWSGSMGVLPRHYA